MKTPKYIMGKDFHKHVGKRILMPYPGDPGVPPVELRIVKVENKQVTMGMDYPDGSILLRTDNYSKDKNKYLIVE